MNALDLAFEVKALEESGQIEGLAVAYGNVDHGGDRVLPGAVDMGGQKSIPMLLFHDPRRPVGVWNEFEETAKGLRVKGQIITSTRDGQEAYELVKGGALSGLSMGYNTMKERAEGAVRNLVKLMLHEVSLVTVPMNSKTRVLGIKQLFAEGAKPPISEFEEFLREVGGASKSVSTAIASKGYAALFRGEPGSKSEAAEFFAALLAD